MTPQNALKQEYIGNKVEILVSVLYHRMLRPGDVAVDGGANGGPHAVPMGHRVEPNGAIYAYEPQPDVFEELVRHVALDNLQETVHCRRKALGASPGHAKFFINPDNNALSSLDPEFAREGAKEIGVE